MDVWSNLNEGTYALGGAMWIGVAIHVLNLVFGVVIAAVLWWRRAELLSLSPAAGPVRGGSA